MQAPSSSHQVGAADYVRALFVSATGLRLAYLLVRFRLGDPDTHRFHVESAAALFVLAGALASLTTRRDPAGPLAPARSPAHPWIAWLLYTLAAFALFAPALGVGFLSDDFYLIDQAAHGHIGEINVAFFRPAPLAAWALLHAAGMSAVVFHALNITLHGTNAFLASRVAARWLPGRFDALLTGAFVLTASLSPEAVVWCSGLFDLSFTACALLMVLLSRDYDAASFGRRAAFYAVAALAICCKETAVVAPALVAIDAWIARRWSRKLIVDTAIVALAFAAFAAWRLVGAFGVTAPTLTRFLAQRALFETYGGLAMPWHSDVLRAMPWLVALGGTVVIVGLGARWLTRRAVAPSMTPLAMWTLIPVVPVLPLIAISEHLEASRYLYLANVGWAAFLMTLPAAMSRGVVRRAMRAAVVALIVCNAVAVRIEIRPWQEAGALRDRVMQALRSNADARACDAVVLLNLPDHVRGAYVFRVGAEQALHAATGQGWLSSGPPACTFTWRPSDETFVH